MTKKRTFHSSRRKLANQGAVLIHHHRKAVGGSVEENLIQTINELMDQAPNRTRMTTSELMTVDSGCSNAETGEKKSWAMTQSFVASMEAVVIVKEAWPA